MILGPYEPINDYFVAIINDAGVPVELIQTSLSDEEIWGVQNVERGRCIGLTVHSSRRRLVARLDTARPTVVAVQPSLGALLLNGSSVFTPSILKSATLRVTTTRLCIRAVAAIIASSSSVSDFR